MFSNKQIKTTLLIIFTLKISIIFGQELLVPLVGNPVIELLSQKKKNEPVKNTGVTLQLPFLDDFSTVVGYPDNDLWADNCAYINQHFVIHGKTIGVATLDALDSEGKLYPLPYGHIYRYADSLSSQTINLNYPASDSLYLSFYYMAGGFGDAPSKGDSLMVDFLKLDSVMKYDPEIDSSIMVEIQKWVKVWAVPGNSNNKWELAMLPIKEEQYRHNKFRFRFRNIISPSSGGVIPTNCDFWHLDHVYLNKNRNINDTIIKDVAFTRPPNSVLMQYSSIPWKHYRLYSSTLTGNVDFYFTNHDNVNSQNVTLYYKVSGKYNKIVKNNLGEDSIVIVNIPPDSTSLGTNNYNAFAEVYRSTSAHRNIFSLIDVDSVEYLVETKMITSTHYPASTKKAGRIHKFSNYYAYDDGSAENGYDINAQGGRVAIKFNTFIPDLLQGVYIYFNETGDAEASMNFFDIYVWSDDGGKPGQVIYEKNANTPVTDGKFGWKYFSFESAISIQDVFFIGWKKNTTRHISAGYDKNTNTTQKNFYNIGQGWVSSQYNETIMIRPVFSQVLLTHIIEDIPVSENKLKPDFYPVPAQNEIYFDYPDKYRKWTVRITDICGRTVLEQIRPEIINVNHLPSGIYIATFIEGQEIYKSKLIIQK